MLMSIFKKAFSRLMEKPVRLWGISLLFGLLSAFVTPLCGVAIPLIGIVVSLLLSTSMTMIYLRGYRGGEVKAVHLFDCFKDWNTIKRVACGMGWRTLWIAIWSAVPAIIGGALLAIGIPMLSSSVHSYSYYDYYGYGYSYTSAPNGGAIALIILGSIALLAAIVIALIRTYEYRFTPYILMQEPEVAITDAIKLSKERTNGYKGKLFWGDVLPYVAFFAVSLVLGLLSAIPYLGILFRIVGALLSVAFALLAPLYIGLVRAAFYDEITAGASEPEAPEAPEEPVVAEEPEATEEPEAPEATENTEE